MKEINQLRDLFANAAAFIAEMESNKETIQSMSAYITATLNDLGIFVQGNLETITKAFFIGIINTWGTSMLKGCEYLGEAREILISHGFTSEEAYAIISDRKDELISSLKNIPKTIKESSGEKATTEDKQANKKDRRPPNIRGMEIGNKN